MKKCSKCGVEKDLIEFNTRRNFCKECQYNYQKIYRINNKEIATKSVQSWRINNPIKTLLMRYKNNAKKRNYIFKLTLEEFTNLIKQPCHYCGKESKMLYQDINGIDRKDNTQGYILDNCLPCCKVCNQAKMDISYEDFKQWVQRISNHFLTK